MQAFEPDFEIIKMDAEIGSYQEDFDPEPAPELLDPPRSAASDPANVVPQGA